MGFRYGFRPDEPTRKRRKQTTIEFLKHFMLGGVSASIGKTAFAPVERVKLLLQLQSSSMRISQEKQYKGAIDCFMRIPKEEGIIGYWKGNFTNVLRYFPNQALCLASRDEYKKFFVGGVDKRTHGKRYFWGNIAAGAASGATALTFVYPLDFARTRLAMDIGRRKQRQFLSLRDCVKKIYKGHGIFGLYMGFRMSIYGIVMYRGTSFGLYDMGKEYFNIGKDTLWMSMLMAQSATVVAGFASYPFDTVSRRMMMQSGMKPEERKYKGTIHCWTTMIREEGIFAFYRGAFINAFRCTGAALVLVMYEELKKFV